MGLVILAVGIWAWTEKDTINNLKRLTSVAVDPAFLLIITGLVTFVIGFTGCVGALRENTFLLALVSLHNVHCTKPTPVVDYSMLSSWG